LLQPPRQDRAVGQPSDLVEAHEDQEDAHDHREQAQRSGVRSDSGQDGHDCSYVVRYWRDSRAMSIANDHASAVSVSAAATALSATGTMGASATLSPTNW